MAALHAHNEENGGETAKTIVNFCKDSKDALGEMFSFIRYSKALFCYLLQSMTFFASVN